MIMVAIGVVVGICALASAMTAVYHASKLRESVADSWVKEQQKRELEIITLRERLTQIRIYWETYGQGGVDTNELLEIAEALLKHAENVR